MIWFNSRFKGELRFLFLFSKYNLHIKKIMIESLNYWNVDLQEAYYSFNEAQLKREKLK